MNQRMAWTIFGLTAAAWTGCGGGGGHAEEAHAVSAEYAGPIDSSDTARGEEVYAAICSNCHQGEALHNIGWSAGQIRHQVREGRGNMPAFSESRINNSDLEALLAYMTTIGAVTDPLPGAEEPTAGDEAEPPAEAEENASEDATEA